MGAGKADTSGEHHDSDRKTTPLTRHVEEAAHQRVPASPVPPRSAQASGKLRLAIVEVLWASQGLREGLGTAGLREVSNVVLEAPAADPRFRCLKLSRGQIWSIGPASYKQARVRNVLLVAEDLFALFVPL